MPWLRAQVVSKQWELWRVAPVQGHPDPFGAGHPQLRVLVFVPSPQVSLQCPHAAQGHHLALTKSCEKIMSMNLRLVIGVGFINQELLYLDKWKFDLPHTLQDFLQISLTLSFFHNEEWFFLKHFLADAEFPKLDPNLPLHFDLNLLQLNFNLLQSLSLWNASPNPKLVQPHPLTSIAVPRIDIQTIFRALKLSIW